MSEEEASEGYYSDAPVPSPLACGLAAEQGAQVLEECYESDEASTISSYESDAPMELETLTDEEQTEDEGSDGCIPNSVLDSWMATQVLPQGDVLPDDYDECDCQSSSDDCASIGTQIAMEDEEEIATSCNPSDLQEAMAHNLANGMDKSSDDFSAWGEPVHPVAHILGRIRLPLYRRSIPSLAPPTIPARRSQVRKEGGADYDPANHQRLAKMNKSLRRKLRTKQRQFRVKDAKIVELSGQVKELDKQIAAYRLLLAKSKRAESDLGLVIDQRDREILQKDAELLETKRKLSLGNQHYQQVHFFIKGLAGICNSWRADDDCAQTCINGDDDVLPSHTSPNVSGGLPAPRTLFPHITLRNFLDKVQEKLAFAAGLIPDFPDPSRQGSTLWRKRLSGDPPHRNTDAERLATARELFQGLGSANASRALVLLNSSGAQLTTKLSSEIRRRGDAVAHGPLSKRDMVMAIESLGITDGQREAYCALQDFLFS